MLYDELMGKYRMWYFCRMGPHWRFAGGTYQIPGLYIPRTDEKPYHCHGLRADSYGREFADNDRGGRAVMSRVTMGSIGLNRIWAFLPSMAGSTIISSGLCTGRVPALASDEIRWPVQCKNADFSSLSTAVRIRLIANRAKVYSFSFAN